MIRRIGLIVFVVVLAMVPLLPPFYLTVCSYIGLYSMVALGLVLLTGVTGLLSFGQAAFMGLGAYTTAMLTLNLHWSPWLTLFISLGLTLVVSLFLGGITLRMGGHYLPLTTMMWGIGLYYLFGSIPSLGGYTGLTDIPPLNFFGHRDAQRAWLLLPDLDRVPGVLVGHYQPAQLAPGPGHPRAQIRASHGGSLRGQRLPP